MDFTFSFGWMFAGLAIAIAGGLVVIFYRQISHGLADGVSSYDKVKRYGVIAVIVGLLVAMNLHVMILTFVFGLATGKM